MKYLYNVLALVNIILGFIFVIALAKKYGTSKQADTYFIAVMIVTYLGFIVQAIWDAVDPYYMKLKYEKSNIINFFYSSILNGVVILSLMIILAYFTLSNFIHHEFSDIAEFLNVFIFYILIQNVIIFNKKILNLESYFVASYLSEMFILIINIFSVLFFVDDILGLAYSTLIGGVLVIFLQLYILLKKAKLSYSITVSFPQRKEFFQNSFKSKLAVIIYGAKDPIIAFVCVSYGSGYLSMYNYANKFATALYQIVNAPLLNVYITKVNKLIASGEHFLILNEVKNVLKNTLFLYLVSSVMVYFFLPLAFNKLISNTVTNEEVEHISTTFLILALFYFIITVETPFARLVSAFKLFNYSLFVNTIFISLIGLIFILKLNFDFNFYMFLSMIVVCQMINAVLFIHKVKKQGVK